MVSFWLPILFFARGAATDFLRGLALKTGHSRWGVNATRYRPGGDARRWKSWRRSRLLCWSASWQRSVCKPAC
jgi:hypothetical protein